MPQARYLSGDSVGGEPYSLSSFSPTTLLDFPVSFYFAEAVAKCLPHSQDQGEKLTHD